MSKIIKLKRGLDIPLKGMAARVLVEAEPSGSYALKPPDIKGLVPKLVVKPGQTVKAGSPLFYDKTFPDIVFTSPVSGTVLGVNRGERRRILEVTVSPDAAMEYESFGKADPLSLSRDEVIGRLLKSGTWPLIRQRPYALTAQPTVRPKAIFISAFDTAPLAPDLDFIMDGEEHNFQTGLNALKMLTDGQLHLSLHATKTQHPVFNRVTGVEKHLFTGPHPAGNVGIQIHHIDPINKGDKVWYINAQDVLIIGRLFNEGRYDCSRIVALTGSEVKMPRYYKTRLGASVHEMVRDNVMPGQLRYISGNVLTGTTISSIGYIGYYDSQVTVIPEGKHHEFLGWAKPGLGKFSHSRSFFSWLFPSQTYRLDTNLQGGERAFVLTGQYERVLPMDIYPVHLLKAILDDDVDRMEQLGIYEVIEEDLALCEFVCTSKIEVQAIVRRGIELMIKELGL